MGLFGKDKTPDPKEQVNEWSRKIRKERNGLDRQIRQIERTEAQAIKSIKEAAKKNDPDSAKVCSKFFSSYICLSAVLRRWGGQVMHCCILVNILVDLSP